VLCMLCMLCMLCRAILSSNRWKVRSVDGFILFPGSDHIETVVVYDRI